MDFIQNIVGQKEPDNKTPNFLFCFVKNNSVYYTYDECMETYLRNEA